jgi:DNA recombination protein RmuC
VTEVLLGAGALLLVVLAVLLVSLGRRVEELRRAQESLRADSAKSHAEALSQLFAPLQTAVGSFQDRVDALARTVAEGQGKTAETLQVGLAEASRTVGDVRTQMGALEEATKNLQKLQREIADLQNVLRAPKLRGNLGELLLHELLDQILPPSAFETPYRFADGSAVDAVIRLRDHLVPVDAKFPLEAFQRMATAEDEAQREVARKEFVASVRARVDEIAARYIRPAEGTAEFALLYFPAEGLYYEVVIRDEALARDGGVLAYALERRVIPVSPNTLYAYLATIVMGLRGLHIEEEARKIQSRVADLQRGFEKFFEVFVGLGRNLDLARRKFDDATRRAERVNDLMGRISGERAELPEPAATEGEEIEIRPATPLPAERPALPAE